MNFKNWFIFSENNEKNKKVAFADVKFNTIDKYYIDMNTAKNSNIKITNSFKVGGFLEKKYTNINTNAVA